MERLGKDVRQPISLRLKWGVLLFIIIFSVSFLANVLMLRQNLLEVTKQYEADFMAQADGVTSYLESHDAPFIFIENDKEPTVSSIERYGRQHRITTVLSGFELDKYHFKIYTPQNVLIYQSDSTPIRRTDSELRIDRKIYSKNSGIQIGRLEMLQKMNAFDVYKKPYIHNFLIITLGLFIVSLILGFFISYLFLRPLTYLINSLDLVEEENLSDIRVRKPRSNDEWSDLSVHVNRLLDKIDLYVTNQKQFVEDVSHELRTPVAIVEGHLKLLNRWGKDDPEILEESIEASLQEISRMKTLVQEMLDLSRADHVDIDYKDAVTEVISTTKQVYSNFKVLYPDYTFFLDLDRSIDNVYVKMYRNHFEQILIILLDNAIKYGRDRHEIHIAISLGFNNVEIAVQDFGEGMSEEDKEKVFGRFYRIDKARSRDKGGTGLGLSIAKQLVQSYRGEIWVDSVLKQGSIFYIEFPVLTDQKQIDKGLQIEQHFPVE